MYGIGGGGGLSPTPASPPQREWDWKVVPWPQAPCVLNKQTTQVFILLLFKLNKWSQRVIPTLFYPFTPFPPSPLRPTRSCALIGILHIRRGSGASGWSHLWFLCPPSKGIPPKWANRWHSGSLPCHPGVGTSLRQPQVGYLRNKSGEQQRLNRSPWFVP